MKILNKTLDLYIYSLELGLSFLKELFPYLLLGGAVLWVLWTGFNIEMDSRCENGEYVNAEVREMACGGGDIR